MIKSKMLTSYYGRKAYADGFYGRIREFRVIENADGFREEYALDIGGDELMDFERVVVMEKLHFLTKNNVIVAIAVVDGRTYVGSAVLNPNDEQGSTMLGRRLALARALQDPDGERVVRFRIHLEELGYVSDGDDDDSDDEDDEDELDGNEDLDDEDESDGDEEEKSTYSDYEDSLEEVEETNSDGTEETEEHFI